MEAVQMSCLWIFVVCTMLVTAGDAALMKNESIIALIPMKPVVWTGTEQSVKRAVTPVMPKAISNHEVLRSLGLAQLNIQPSHHQKRLASQTRHHARADDSHMFVIKLPPSQHYYSFGQQPGSTFSKNSFGEDHKKVPVGFKSNGKPGRIYHWNIPVMKKIVGTNQGRRQSNYRHVEDKAALIDIKHIPTWQQPWENEAMDKPLDRLDDNRRRVASKKHYKKKKTPSYYAPVKSRQTNFNKYFTNNGKPKGFYVIDNKRATSYHQLIQ